MKTRLLTAAIALPIIIASIILPIYYPQAIWLFVVIAASALAAGLFEFYSLTKKLELKADAAIGYAGAAVLFVGFIFDAPAKMPEILLLTLALLIVAVLISQTFRFQADFSKMLTGIGVTIVGVLYVAFLGGFLVATRVGFENGSNLSTHLLAYFFLVIFGSDAGAYFAGRSFGKHKLAPNISPGKTVEGLIGGLVAAAAFAVLSTFWFFPELPFKWSIPLAIVLAAVGVLGDLCESAMKRGSKTKDAASILPGHGGLLDRLDSLLFGAPILYYFSRFYF
ncbi:MAG TPA: phosphatidate cytidylyltransferase [Pyrinomonadaceae bacterium]|nr:phosphatidate cytidylyltransferase [Chloracidobacterium sp.]MBP9935579.1 phosphatidate cytidylyltransferase [Pyrinomonadaceae bacterium]MBK7801136.1 phosphatidate cytidylyltransferase [Chloracidobacterium sp.]MBL0241441.1 phosphatidate cytidylyltransferase [Chloracidobacterium sp.]HQX55374.1 phosphatidate cytidylyltransferase [Pyrinomonadaceae bacterium]